MVKLPSKPYESVAVLVTVIVPTFNEKPNVPELVRRVAAMQSETDAALEILFVDDSTDGTPDEVRRVAKHASIPVSVLHRDEPTAGLSGAVVEGLQTAGGDACIVIDGDLQHPPELIPELIARFEQGDADIVVASRYLDDGDAEGLAGRMRRAVSTVSTLVTKSMFPRRLHGVSDPMTGYFLVDRRAINLTVLKPQGFKILLELLVRGDLRVAEVPMHFAERTAGDSKASLRQGTQFMGHLWRLRFGKMSVFALIGGFGALLNLAIMWALTSSGMGYMWAAIIGAEVTIIGNFLLQEKFVFGDMRDEAQPLWKRFVASFTFNNIEAALRLPVLAFLVENWHLSSVFALAITLFIAFFVRYLFHALIVYAPRRRATRTSRVLDEVDKQLTSPGEL